jgi:hypothetical protein
MIHFKYNPALSDDYCTKLQDRISTINLNACIEDMSAAALSKLIHDNICMVVIEVFGQKQPPSAHHHCHKPWFDSKCRVQKKQVRVFLKVHPDCDLTRHLQKNLKQLLKPKKRTYEKLMGMQMCKLAKADPAGLWKKYRVRKEASHGIQREALRQGFAALLGPPIPPDPVVPIPECDEPCSLS